ncbi:cation:proton antiporter [Oscillospiraceae bacterium LTW-04]|nr:cation:proton antiporter [Oscillospiraceae bacterium MB24-C1]
MLTSLALIFLLGLLFGVLFERLKLPPLLGMIVTGMILGPHAFNLLDQSILNISAELRQLALVIILTRAGLSLDVADLKRVGRPAVLMCFVPASLEIIGVIIIAPIILGVTQLQAAIMGSVLAAVSPAVIVPRMITIMAEGYGKKHSIPQLILAGASVDDVFVIVLFTAFISLAAGGDFSAAGFAEIPVSIVLGIIVGAVCGLLLMTFFKRFKIRNSIKVLIMLSISFLLIECQNRLEGILPMSGLLAIMSLGIALYQKCPDLSEQLASKYNKLWLAAQILLFVLVGATVDLRYVKMQGYAAVIIVLGALLFRILGVWLCLIKTGLPLREKYFCMLAYTPKATVQAAIGAIPLSMGLAGGQQVLTVAVLSILITAPLGAMAIDRLYKKLLKQDGDT